MLNSICTGNDHKCSINSLPGDTPAIFDDGAGSISMGTLSSFITGPSLSTASPTTDTQYRSSDYTH